MNARREECWIFISETIPAPLRGNHRVVGNSRTVKQQLEDAKRRGCYATLVLLSGSLETTAYLNPEYVLAVLA